MHGCKDFALRNVCFWKTPLIKEKSYLAEKSLLMENFLQEGKIFACGSFIHKEKMFACGKLL